MAWYADTVLQICWPLEAEPSLDDVGAQQDADQEAEEEVGVGGRVGREDVWPEQQDPVDHLIALVEDIRNIIQSSAAPSVADGPGSVAPPAEPGHPIHVRAFHTVPPNYRVRALAVAATGLESWIAGKPCVNAAYYREAVGLLDSMSGAVVTDK
jgi:hypothetical protein